MLKRKNEDVKSANNANRFILFYIKELLMEYLMGYKSLGG